VDKRINYFNESDSESGEKLNGHWPVDTHYDAPLEAVNKTIDSLSVSWPEERGEFKESTGGVVRVLKGSGELCNEALRCRFDNALKVNPRPAVVNAILNNLNNLLSNLRLTRRTRQTTTTIN